MDYDVVQQHTRPLLADTASLWVIDPARIVHDDIEVEQRVNGVTVHMNIVVDNDDTIGVENARMLGRLARTSPYFPITNFTRAYNTFEQIKYTIEAVFKPPFYSTPVYYIGKPQMRPQEAYARAQKMKAAFTFIFNSATHDSTKEDIQNLYYQALNTFLSSN